MADTRGGPRQAAVGVHTPNRTDMQTPGQHITPGNLPASQGYGQGVRQAAALRAVPTAGGKSGSSSSSVPHPVQLGPGDVPSLSDPSANPNEPVTAGLPIGPGPGPEALPIMAPDSPDLGIARALYLQYPNADLRRYIAYLEDTLQFQ